MKVFQKRQHIPYHLVVLLVVVLALSDSWIGKVSAAKAPSELPASDQIKVYLESIDNIKIENEAGSVETVTQFTNQKGSIYSMKLVEMLSDVINVFLDVLERGSTSNKTLDQFTTFKDNEIYNIGGCVTFQTQGEITKLTSVENFLDSVNNYRAKLSAYIINDLEMIIFVSDFSAYKFEFTKNIILPTVTYLFSFKSKLSNLGSAYTMNPTIKAFSYNQTGYIISQTQAWKYPLSSFHLDTLQDQTIISRFQIFDVNVYKNLVLISCGISGVDVYRINDSTGNLEWVQTIGSDAITVWDFETHEFMIVRSKIVEQKSKLLLLLEEQNESIYVFTIDFDPSNKLVLTQKYEIPLSNISSFDAYQFQIVAVMSHKTYNSGISIFFDSESYYVNYFENDELQVNDVLLDPNTKIGLWVGEDISKSFIHSVYTKNLMENRFYYEDFVAIDAERELSFVTISKTRFLFAMGVRSVQIFTITPPSSYMVCSSTEPNIEKKYHLTIASSECLESQPDAESALHMFNKCLGLAEVTFKTTEPFIDSTNVGLAVGLTVGILAIIAIVLVVVWRRHRRNQREIKDLEVKQLQYQTFESKEQELLKVNG